MMAWARILGRDLRHIAVPLVAVVVVDLVAILAGRAGMVHPEFFVWPVRLLMLALGAHVVLSDPVSGPLAHWRTRPVPGGAMAVGKTLALAGVAFGAGVAMLAVQLASGMEVWPGVTVALWEVFRAALWVMLGAALAVLVEGTRGFFLLAAAMLAVAALVVAGVYLAARHSDVFESLVVRGAREHGRMVMAAGTLAMVCAFFAVARRYVRPHQRWLARGLVWVACLLVLGHEGLRLLVGQG